MHFHLWVNIFCALLMMFCVLVHNCMLTLPMARLNIIHLVHSVFYSPSACIYMFTNFFIFHVFEGRNRKLQGLAAAILKLWEKSLIAKIALKWGVPNTNNEQMACELKASFLEIIFVLKLYKL